MCKPANIQLVVCLPRHPDAPDTRRAAICRVCELQANFSGTQKNMIA